MLSCGGGRNRRYHYVYGCWIGYRRYDLQRVELPIEDTDTTGILFEKLSIAGADLLKRTLPDLLAGRIEAVPQNEADAIYSPNIRREDELLDWSRSAMNCGITFEDLNPFPGAYTFWNGEVLKVWASLKPDQAE